MENPQEVPLGENKYSQDLEEYGLVPTDKQIKIITTEIDKAIEREHPLQLLHTNSHLGDHYIIRSALEVVLAEYCRTKGINKTANISLSHTPIKGAIDLPRLTSAFGNHFLSYQ